MAEGDGEGERSHNTSPDSVEAVDVAYIESPGDFFNRPGESGARLFAESIKERRETMRGIIALALMALLALEIILSLLVISLINKDQVPAVQDWLKSVLPVTVALFGAVTGFYFGSSKSESS